LSEQLVFTTDNPLEIGIRRRLTARPSVIWRCFTEPELLKLWYCPKPWYVSRAEIDVRPGGASFLVMNGPNGEEHAMPGQYLEVEEGRKLTFTDAFSGDFIPHGTPFMVGVVELEPATGGGTILSWSARHWSQADVDKHLEMGFEGGWNAAADQLEALSAQL
jgi:uncharacterized protein YndB with AHSA1/START domain